MITYMTSKWIYYAYIWHQSMSINCWKKITRIYSILCNNGTIVIMLKQTSHALKYSHALSARVSSFLLALWSPRLGKRELVCVLLVHLLVCFACVSLFFFFFSFFSSSRGRGLAAVCDCGTPWTFLFLLKFQVKLCLLLWAISRKNMPSGFATSTTQPGLLSDRDQV